MIVFAQMFEHTQKFIAFQPAELTLISAILKTNMVTPIVFAFSDRKWIKKCLYQIWAKSYRFWN